MGRLLSLRYRCGCRLFVALLVISANDKGRSGDGCEGGAFLHMYHFAQRRPLMLFTFWVPRKLYAISIVIGSKAKSTVIQLLTTPSVEVTNILKE